MVIKEYKIIIDCAHGAGYKMAPIVFSELGATVVTIGVSPNGLNINKNCGSTSPMNLVRTLLYESADLGVAIDGDGDRLIMIDHQGKIVDGDQLLFIIAKWRKKMGLLPNEDGIVGTIMTNMGVEKSLKNLSIPLLRAKVGDKYIIEELQEQGWNLGGESSGHIVNIDSHTTGDGIISALHILSIMCYEKKDLSELTNQMEYYPSVLISVNLLKIVDLNKILIYAELRVAMKVANNLLGINGRVIIRKSGTESVIRVLIEGESEKLIKKIAYMLVEVLVIFYKYE